MDSEQVVQTPQSNTAKQMLHTGPALLHREDHRADQVMMPSEELNNLDLSTLFDDVDHLL